MFSWYFETVSSTVLAAWVLCFYLDIIPCDVSGSRDCYFYSITFLRYGVFQLLIQVMVKGIDQCFAIYRQSANDDLASKWRILFSCNVYALIVAKSQQSA